MGTCVLIFVGLPIGAALVGWLVQTMKIRCPHCGEWRTTMQEASTVSTED